MLPNLVMVLKIYFFFNIHASVILFLCFSQVKANALMKNGLEYFVNINGLSQEIFCWSCRTIAHIFMEWLMYHILWDLEDAGFPKSFITKA